MGKCIFITGGVRSGKSAFAEAYVKKYDLPAAYVATSEAFDQEMKERIERHQYDRLQQSTKWQLYEMPYELQAGISETIVLFECVTTWLANMIFLKKHDNAVHIFKEWLMGLLQQEKTVIVVSNEVLDAGLTSYTETNTYLQTIGQLHVWLVQISEEAYELDNRIIKQWK